MTEYAKWDLQAVRVHLVICNSLEELKDMWEYLQPVFCKMPKAEREVIINYKNELKEKFINNCTTNILK